MRDSHPSSVPLCCFSFFLSLHSHRYQIGEDHKQDGEYSVRMVGSVGRYGEFCGELLFSLILYPYAMPCRRELLLLTSFKFYSYGAVVTVKAFGLFSCFFQGALCVWCCFVGYILPFIGHLMGCFVVFLL